MITRFGLTNFKSWAELDIELGPITVLFGPNSSGKTGMLDALLALKQTAASFDRGRHFNFGGSERDYVDLGSFQDVVFDHDNELEVAVRLSWKTGQQYILQSSWGREVRFPAGTMMSYEAHWRLENDQAVIGMLAYELPKASFSMKRVDADQYEIQHQFQLPEYNEEFVSSSTPSQLPPPESCYAIPLEVLKYFGPIAWVFNQRFENLMEQIAYLGPLRDAPRRAYIWAGDVPQVIGKHGERAIEALIAAERSSEKDHTSLLEPVTGWMRQLGLVEDFVIKPIDRDRRYYETRVRTVANAVDDCIADVGFGVSQALPIVTQLFFVPEGSIVLLEQPEIHLHPSAQAALADLFLHVAEERNLQLIIESHSEYLLTRLQRRIAEADYEFANPENIRLYFCEITADGSKITEVEANQYGEIVNWPENFFGDKVGDLNAMSKAGIQRRRREIAESE